MNESGFCQWHQREAGGMTGLYYIKFAPMLCGGEGIMWREGKGRGSTNDNNYGDNFGILMEAVAW